MAILLMGRKMTWFSVFILFPLAGVATFFFAWNLSRKWPSPDRLTKIFLIAAMILNALFSVKCLFMVHSLRLQSKALSFALWATLAVSATICNCVWFIFMVTRKGYDGLCDGSQCQRRVISIAFSAFVVVYAILTFLIMLIVFYFDAHWNYTAPTPTPAPAPPNPYVQIPPMTTAQSLRKRFLPSSARLHNWSPFTSSEQKAEKGHIPLINITHEYEDDQTRRGRTSESEVLFDSAGPEGKSRKGKDGNGDFDASSTEEEDSEEDEEAQLEYERKRRERKGKYRADEAV